MTRYIDDSIGDTRDKLHWLWTVEKNGFALSSMANKPKTSISLSSSFQS